MEEETRQPPTAGGGWPWGFSLGKKGPLFHREIGEDATARVSDFRSLCSLISYVRANKSGSSNSSAKFGAADVFVGLREAIQAFTVFVQSRLGRPEFDFYIHLLPNILRWATTIEDDFVRDLPLLERNVETTSTLSSRQIRHILANSFILNVSDLHPLRFGNICFGGLYAISIPVSVHRIICQLAYFYRASDAPQRDLTFTRFKLEVCWMGGKKTLTLYLKYMITTGV